MIVLPLATRPSFIGEAVKSLAGKYSVVTWEARLILKPQVRLTDRTALSIESHLKDVDVIVNYFGIGRASLIGYCSGASLALHIAASNRRFSKLALINGAYFLQPDECELTQYERDVLALVPPVATDYDHASYVFNRFFAGNTSFKGSSHEFAKEFYLPYEDVDSFFRFGICLDNFIRSDWKQIVREIKMPTLVACGRLDDRTHYSSSMLIASHIAASKTYIDQAGDHYEFCRAKPYLIDKLTNFLSTGEAGV